MKIRPKQVTGGQRRRSYKWSRQKGKYGKVRTRPLSLLNPGRQWEWNEAEAALQAAWPRMPSSAAPEDLHGVDKTSISKTLTVRGRKGTPKKEKSWQQLVQLWEQLLISQFLPRAKRRGVISSCCLLEILASLEFITRWQFLTRIRAKWRHYSGTENSLPAYLYEMKGQKILFLRPMGNCPRSSEI